MNVRLSLLIGAACIFCAEAARAQTQTSPAPDASQSSSDNAESGGLADIIVTAQRREQNQQSVPIAVTTITAAALSASGAATTEDLMALTPGLTFNRQLKGATPYIRGVGTQSIAAGVESPIATYIDGVYYMSAVGNVFSFNNVDRVEILKGPQGTLFGRNATGGLINVVTRDPRREPSVEGAVSLDNYTTVDAKLYATAGLTDNLAADVAIQWEHQYDGFGTYLGTGHDALYRRDIGVRSKVLWEPGPDDRLTLAFDWSKDEGDIGATRDLVDGAVSATGLRAAGGFYDIQSNLETYVNTEYWGASLKYERKLGDGTLTFLNAYRNLDSQVNIDSDNTAVAFLAALISESNRTWQSEILYNGSANNLDYTVGAFYFNARSAYDPLSIRSPRILVQNYDTFPVQDTRSYAGYAQGTYHLGPRTEFTAGVRFTKDEREFSATRYAASINPVAAGTVLLSRARTQVNYNKLTWRFALDHHFTDRVMVYASYDRGFKSGVFNSALETQPPVRPETLDAFSAGFKSELFDRQLRLNLAAFHYEYKDIQLSRLDGGTLSLLNAAKGRANGFELEGLFAPRMETGELEISFGGSYLDAKYISFPNGPLVIPNPGTCTPVPRSTGPAIGGNLQCSVDLSGRRMVRSPEYSFNVGMNYTIPVGSNELRLAASYSRQAKFFWEPDNRLVQPSYGLLNTSIRLGFGDDQRFGVSIFAKNLTDAQYSVYIAQNSLGDVQAPAPPRTFGGGFDFKF